jgi:hypothetical protein
MRRGAANHPDHIGYAHLARWNSNQLLRFIACQVSGLSDEDLPVPELPQISKDWLEDVFEVAMQEGKDMERAERDSERRNTLEQQRINSGAASYTPQPRLGA